MLTMADTRESTKPVASFRLSNFDTGSLRSGRLPLPRPTPDGFFFLFPPRVEGSPSDFMLRCSAAMPGGSSTSEARALPLPCSRNPRMRQRSRLERSREVVVSRKGRAELRGTTG